MVHLEMRYLTHSKFFTTMIPDILLLFCARFKFFWWIVTWILFHSRFEVIEAWCSFPLLDEVQYFSRTDTLTFFRTRFRVLDDHVTSLFFCTRFWSNISFLFRLRFGNGFVLFPFEVRNGSCKMTLLSSFARGFDFLFFFKKNDASILFHLRFWFLIVICDFIPLSHEVWNYS